jgi:pimeloyl-ACP methyl ester carboxylesterase
VKHLIVIDIALRNYAPADNIAQQAIMHQKIIKTLSELDISVNSRSDADKQLGKTIESPAIRRFLLKNLKRNDAGTGFYWQLNLMALADNLEYLLDNVAIGGRQFENPVLVINGNKSGYISQEDHGEFHEYFTNCTILSFNTGHWVHAEEPDRLLEEVKRFLG